MVQLFTHEPWHDIGCTLNKAVSRATSKKNVKIISMGYLDFLLPLAFGVMAISIPQILIREDHPKLESRVVLFRRLGYGLVALTVIYGILRYLV